MNLSKKVYLNIRYFLSIIFNKDLIRMLVLNRKTWKRIRSNESYADRVVLSEQASGADFWSLIVSITSGVVAAAYKARVVILINKKSSPKNLLNLVQRSFFSCRFVYLGDLLERNKISINERARVIFNTLSSPADILNLKYRDIAIGEQVYDSILKGKHATLWRIDSRVLIVLEQAINCVDCILDILDRHNVQAGIFTHTTGVYHGVAVRSMLQRGKPVFLGFGGLNALYKYNRVLNDLGHLDIHIKIPISQFRELLKSNREKLLTDSSQYFKERFGGNINDWDAMRAFSADKKIYKERKDFFNDYPSLSPAKRNVFVMLHAMNDDPHVQRQHIFKDYYDWFAETLKFANTDNSVNWIFKQHPMIKHYPDDANLHGLFDLLGQERSIVYIDETVAFNSASIPNLADAVITCAGTAGLEFAAFGVPAIIAAGNSYSGYNVCLEPQSKTEYLELLSRAAHLEPVNEDKRMVAQILFYLIYKKVIPGYLVGIFPYLNHDQIKALKESDAIRLYLSWLSKNNFEQLEGIIAFVSQSGDLTDAEVYLNVK